MQDVMQEGLCLQIRIVQITYKRHGDIYGSIYVQKISFSLYGYNGHIFHVYLITQQQKLTIALCIVQIRRANMNCAVQSKYQNLYSIDIIQREDTIFQNHVTQNTSFPMCMILIIGTSSDQTSYYFSYICSYNTHDSIQFYQLRDFALILQN